MTSRGSLVVRLVSVAVTLAVWLPSDAAVRLRPAGVIYADSKGQPLRGPMGVACDGETLAVSDTENGRLVLYDIGAEEVAPRSEIVAPPLAVPTRLRIASGGDLLVLDGRQRRIGRLAADGSFEGYLDPPRSPGQRSFVPRSLDVDREGTLWVLDVFAGRVIALADDGSVLREIAFPESYGFLSDVAVGPTGVVYAIDSVGARLFAAAPDDGALSPLGGPLSEELDFPTSLAAGPGGRLFLADQNGSGLVVVGSDGSFRGRQSGMGWKAGFLRYPSALCITSDGGSLFVADRENDRVQRFRIAE